MLVLFPGKVKVKAVVQGFDKELADTSRKSVKGLRR